MDVALNFMRYSAYYVQFYSSYEALILLANLLFIVSCAIFLLFNERKLRYRLKMSNAPIIILIIQKRRKKGTTYQEHVLVQATQI